MTTNDATLVELNERYKDKPVSEATYEIDGQLLPSQATMSGRNLSTRSFTEWLLKEPMQKPLDKSEKIEKRTCHIQFSAL